MRLPILVTAGPGHTNVHGSPPPGIREAPGLKAVVAHFRSTVSAPGSAASAERGPFAPRSGIRGILRPFHGCCSMR